MLAGINDSEEVAKELGELLKDQKVVLFYYLGFYCFATAAMMEFDAYKWIFQCPIM
jgi:L-lysine 2,3-aminomutase